MMRMFAVLSLAGALVLGSSLQAQNAGLPRDVFVLVDVSGSMVGSRFSIGHAKVLEAKNLVRDLLADQVQWSRYPDWQHSLLSPEILAITNRTAGRTPLLGTGSQLFLKRAGDPATSKAASLEQVISDPVRDVDALFQRFPNESEFNNQRTFLWLARAMTRREAMGRGVTSYLLVEITDAREDKENIVDTDDQVAVREFKNLKHVPVNGEIGSFTHRQTRGEYVLQVNVRLVRLAGGAGVGGGRKTLLSNLQLPQGLVEGEDAVISWDSFNAPGGLSYTVALTPPNGIATEQATPAPPVTFSSLSAGRHTVKISLPLPGSSSLQGQFDVGKKSPPPVKPRETADPGEIVLQSPRRDAKIKPGSVTVSWRVVNPPAGSKYIVTVTGPPGSPKIPKKTVDATRASFSIRKPGPYRVRIAATSREVKPASGTFTVKSQAGKKLLYLMLALIPLAIIAVAAVRHARRRRHGEDGFDAYSENLD